MLIQQCLVPLHSAEQTLYSAELNLTSTLLSLNGTLYRSLPVLPQRLNRSRIPGHRGVSHALLQA